MRPPVAASSAVQRRAVSRRRAAAGWPGATSARIWMTEVKDKVWFRRGGLFAKYVISLVGLVVFVLAANGALEVWISYRETTATLTNAMSEKAEAEAHRIEQTMSE